MPAKVVVSRSGKNNAVIMVNVVMAIDHDIKNTFTRRQITSDGLLIRLNMKTRVRLDPGQDKAGVDNMIRVRVFAVFVRNHRANQGPRLIRVA